MFYHQKRGASAGAVFCKIRLPPLPFLSQIKLSFLTFLQALKLEKKDTDPRLADLAESLASFAELQKMAAEEPRAPSSKDIPKRRPKVRNFTRNSSSFTSPLICVDTEEHGSALRHSYGRSRSGGNEIRY
jgi:hypothetical protein